MTRAVAVAAEVIDLCNSSSDDDEEVMKDNAIIVPKNNGARSRKRAPPNSNDKSSDNYPPAKKLLSTIPHHDTQTLTQPPVADALIYLSSSSGVSDNAQISDNIFDALRGIASNTSTTKVVHVATCVNTTTRPLAAAEAAGGPSSSSSNTSQSSLPPPLRLTLHHIQQPDKWSCGFRNMQMQLAALVPQFAADHPFFSHFGQVNNTPGGGGGGGAFGLPSLRKIEETLEEAWAQGFDQAGARHYGRKLVGRRQWIGAVEVWSVLAHCHVNACVVQFMQCAASRNLLGPFLLAYFTKRHAGCPLCRTGLYDAESLAQSTLQAADALKNNGVSATRVVRSATSCTCPILPLYLQWEGHSVTIVGVECQDVAMQRPVNALLMNPSKDGRQLHNELTRGNIEPARLPLQRLKSKDVQVLVCSTVPLSSTQRQTCKQHTTAVTAARQTVEKSLQQRRR